MGVPVLEQPLGTLGRRMGAAFFQRSAAPNEAGFRVVADAALFRKWIDALSRTEQFDERSGKKQWLEIFFSRGWPPIPGDAEYLLSIASLWPSVFDQTGYFPCEAVGELANLELLAAEGLLSKPRIDLKARPEPRLVGWTDWQPGYLRAVSECLIQLSQAFVVWQWDTTDVNSTWAAHENIAEEIGGLVWGLIELDGRLLVLKRMLGGDPLAAFAKHGSHYAFRGVRADGACLAVRGFVVKMLDRIASLGRPTDPIRYIADAALAGAGWSAFCRRALLLQAAAGLATDALVMTEQDARAFVEKALTEYVLARHDGLHGLCAEPVSDDVLEQVEDAIRQETNGALVGWLGAAGNSNSRRSEDANTTVLRYLELFQRAGQACPTLRELETTLGIPRSTIQRTRAWQTMGAGRRPRTMTDPGIDRRNACPN